MRIALFIFTLLIPFLPLPATQAEDIIEAGMFLNQMGLCPATSGNLSARMDAKSIAITASGKHKGELTLHDVLLVDLNGTAQNSPLKPSAETLMHTAIYALYEEVGAVIHTHSLNGTVLARLMEPQNVLMTEGYEIHKAFPNIKTHDSRIEIPIFENTQDIQKMANEVSLYLQTHPDVYGFLIRGHGFYTWGRTMQEAKNRVEAFERVARAQSHPFRGGLAELSSGCGKALAAPCCRASY
jgi:methylthioribulose-1-phosphate dehydratase